jgi:hypothetical protein
MKATKERKEKYQSGQPVSDQRLEPKTTRIQSYSATYMTVMFAQTLSRLIHPQFWCFM